MPSPLAGIIAQEDKGAIDAMIKKLGTAIRIKNKEMSIKVAIGKEDMDDTRLSDNIEVAIKELSKKLPKGRENIKDALIKFTMGKPVVIMERSTKNSSKKNVRKINK